MFIVTALETQRIKGNALSFAGTIQDLHRILGEADQRLVQQGNEIARLARDKDVLRRSCDQQKLRNSLSSTELNGLASSVASLRARCEQHAATIGTRDHELREARAEIASAGVTLATMQGTIDRQGNDIIAGQSEHTNTKEAMKKLEKELRSQLEKSNNMVGQLKTQLQQREQAAQHTTNKHAQELQSDLSDRDASLKSNAELQEQACIRNGKLEQAQQEVEVAKQQAHDVRTNLERRLLEQSSAYAAEQAKCNDLERRLDDANRDCERGSNDIQTLQGRLNVVDAHSSRQSLHVLALEAEVIRLNANITGSQKACVVLEYMLDESEFQQYYLAVEGDTLAKSHRDRISRPLHHITRIETMVAEKDGVINEKIHMVNQSDEQIKVLNAELDSIINEKQTIDQTLQQRIRELEQTIAQRDESLSSVQSDLNGTLSAFNEARQRHQTELAKVELELKDTRDNFQSKQEQAEQRHRLELAEVELELKDTRDNLQSELDEAEKHHASFVSQVERTRQSLESKLEEAGQQRQELESKLSTSREHLTTKSASVTNLQGHLKKRDKRISDMSGEIGHYAYRIEEYKQHLQERSNSCDELKGQLETMGASKAFLTTRLQSISSELSTTQENLKRRTILSNKRLLHMTQYEELQLSMQSMVITLIQTVQSQILCFKVSLMLPGTLP